MKMEPATSAAPPGSQGHGAAPPMLELRPCGRESAAMIAATQRIAAHMNCVIDARNGSLFKVRPVDDAAPKANRTAVMVNPSPPSQGVEARSGTSASASATETEMLHTVWS